jgi:predicted RNase H-like nuclease (RuvC/YqgF family)
MRDPAVLAAMEAMMAERMPAVLAQRASAQAADRERMAAELRDAEAAYAKERDSIAAKIHAAREAEQKAREVLDLRRRELQQLAERESSMRESFADRRDELWRALSKIPDPRIGDLQRELREELDDTPTLYRSWREGAELRNVGGIFVRGAARDNRAEIDRLQHHLLAEIDACGRWAREGLSGERLDAAIAAYLVRRPHVPMGPLT